jgi:hypothetical protein
MSQLERVKNLLSRVKCVCLEKEFNFIIKYDQKNERGYYDYIEDEDSGEPRVFIQLEYNSKCNKGGEQEYWKGRKWYLSSYMTDDEIIKTAYTAFEACIKHEIMEGFKVDDKILFNPHINFEELLKISDKEIKRN